MKIPLKESPHVLAIKSSTDRATKRQILSVIAKIFEPVGLVVPCIVEAKIIMQQLWLSRCSWDICGRSYRPISLFLTILKHPGAFLVSHGLLLNSTFSLAHPKRHMVLVSMFAGNRGMVRSTCIFFVQRVVLLQLNRPLCLTCSITRYPVVS